MSVELDRCEIAFVKGDREPLVTLQIGDFNLLLGRDGINPTKYGEAGGAEVMDDISWDEVAAFLESRLQEQRRKIAEFLNED
jgi:hypothetical protein